MNKQSIWFKRMLEKHGSEEAIAEVMRSYGNKSKRNTGGIFNAKSDEAAQEARRKGGLNRAEKIRNQKQNEADSQDSD